MERQWQSGGALPVFAGARMQRGFGRFRKQSGNGLGGLLRKLFRSAVPFLIRGGKEVGRQALKAGVAIGEDVLAGKDPKKAATSRLHEATRDMAKKAINHAQSKTQSGGSGRGIKRKRKVKTGNSKKVSKARTSKAKSKTQFSDIFGN